MSKLVNAAMMTVSGAPGTGPITLGAAVASAACLSFAAAGVNDGDVISYVSRDGAAREWGRGTYSSAGPVLARTTIVGSTNGGAAINLSAAAIVSVDALAEDIGASAFTGDSGTGGTAGQVPAPPAGSAAKNYALAPGGAWAAPLLRGYMAGLTLSNDAASPNSVIDIAAGVAMSDDGDALMATPAITKSLAAIWAAGSGNGGLDQGSVLASTWYHGYEIMRPDTGAVDAVFSQAPNLSASVTATNASPAVFSWGAALPFQNGAPIVLGGTAVPGGFTAGTIYYVVAANRDAGTFELAATQGGTAINSTSTGTDVTAASNPKLSANYTKKRYLGSIKTDPSAHILPFYQWGDKIKWNVPVNEANGVTIGTSALTIDLNGVPPGVVVEADLTANIASGSGPGALLLSALAVSDVAPTQGLGQALGTSGATSGEGMALVLTSLAGQIRGRSSVAGSALYLNTLGYTNTRGRLN